MNWHKEPVTVVTYVRLTVIGDSHDGTHRIKTKASTQCTKTYYHSPHKQRPSRKKAYHCQVHSNKLRMLAENNIVEAGLDLIWLPWGLVDFWRTVRWGFWKQNLSEHQIPDCLQLSRLPSRLEGGLPCNEFTAGSCRGKGAGSGVSTPASPTHCHSLTELRFALSENKR